MYLEPFFFSKNNYYNANTAEKKSKSSFIITKSSGVYMAFVVSSCLFSVIKGILQASLRTLCAIGPFKGWRRKRDLIMNWRCAAFLSSPLCLIEQTAFVSFLASDYSVSSHDTRILIIFSCFMVCCCSRPLSLSLWFRDIFRSKRNRNYRMRFRTKTIGLFCIFCARKLWNVYEWCFISPTKTWNWYFYL